MDNVVLTVGFVMCIMMNVKECYTFLCRFSICCCKSSFCMDSLMSDNWRQRWNHEKVIALITKISSCCFNCAYTLD